MGKNIITEKISNLTPLSAIGFTDGSCISNPGPCGAGAFIIVNGVETELKQPVSKRGSILLAELIAIKLVLDFIHQIESKTTLEELTIFSDSQSAIGAHTLNWKMENHKSTIRSISKQIKSFERNHGIKTNIEWTPGHADVMGNETADKLAKEAAKEAEQIPNDAHNTITKQDVRTAARKHIMIKWQNRWENSNRGRFYFNHHENVEDRVLLDIPNKKMSNIINNLRSGFCLNNYLQKINQNIDEHCECGNIETIEHFILHWKL